MLGSANAHDRLFKGVLGGAGKARVPVSIYKPCEIRGKAHAELTPELYQRWGRLLGGQVEAGQKFVVGGDTRASTPELLDALAEGLRLGEDVRIIDRSSSEVRFTTEEREFVVASVVAANITVASVPEKPIVEGAFRLLAGLIVSHPGIRREIVELVVAGVTGDDRLLTRAIEDPLSGEPPSDDPCKYGTGPGDCDDWMGSWHFPDPRIQ